MDDEERGPYFEVLFVLLLASLEMLLDGEIGVLVYFFCLHFFGKEIGVDVVHLEQLLIEHPPVVLGLEILNHLDEIELIIGGVEFVGVNDEVVEDEVGLFLRVCVEEEMLLFLLLEKVDAKGILGEGPFEGSVVVLVEGLDLRSEVRVDLVVVVVDVHEGPLLLSELVFVDRDFVDLFLLLLLVEGREVEGLA